MSIGVGSIRTVKSLLQHLKPRANRLVFRGVVVMLALPIFHTQ